MSPENARHVGTLTPHARMHATGLLLAFPVLRVTSSTRSPSQNRLAGGVPGSFHLHRRAIDVVGPLAVLREAARWCQQQRVTPRCTGPEEVLLEYAGRRRQHLHVAW